MNNIEIIPVEYAKTTLPGDMVFCNGDKNNKYPIVFMVYLLKIGKKSVLIDAGCETMPGFVMTDFIGAVKALENIGVSVTDITDIIITHAHHDHIECVKYFENANIFIEEECYEEARPYFAKNQKVIKFNNELQFCNGVKAVKIGGHAKGSSVVEIDYNNKKYVISGDECYICECLKKQIPTGASYNIEKSKQFCKKYSNGEYTVLFCHDKEIFNGN